MSRPFPKPNEAGRPLPKADLTTNFRYADLRQIRTSENTSWTCRSSTGDGDCGSVEVFANDGRAALTDLMFPPLDANRVTMFAEP